MFICSAYRAKEYGKAGPDQGYLGKVTIPDSHKREFVLTRNNGCSKLSISSD